MFRFCMKCRGAISVFLAIVLLPMLSVASIFVDMSRLRLAEAEAAAAGDLALNTALTDYDAVLKDMYGLFATSQDIDGLLENLEDYYKKSLLGAGITEADANDYVAQIMSLLHTTAGTDDLMRMSIPAGSFKVKKPSDGNLANPAMLKTQIVEFMKYRAPIEFGMGFLDALDSFKDLKKQSKTVEKKNDFYEQQGELLKELEEVWKDICTYQYNSNDQANTDSLKNSKLVQQDSMYYGVYGQREREYYVFPYDGYFEFKYENIKNLAEQFAGPNPLAPDSISDDKYRGCMIQTGLSKLYFAEDFYFSNSSYPNYSYIRYSSDSNAPEKCTVSIGGTVKQLDLYNEDDLAGPQDMVDALNWYYVTLKSIRKYEDRQGVNLAYFQNVQALNTAAKIYNVHVYEQFRRSQYGQDMSNYAMALAHLTSAVRHHDESAALAQITLDTNTLIAKLPDDSDSPNESLVGVCGTQAKKLIEKTDEYIDSFNSINDKIKGYFSDSVGEVRSARNNLASTVWHYYYETHLSDELFNIRAYKSTGSSGKANLESAISKLEGVKTMLEDPNSEYNKQLDAWKTSAEGLGDSAMGKSDLKEIEKAKDVVNLDEVNALLTKLKAALATLKEYRRNVVWPSQYGYEKRFFELDQLENLVSMDESGTVQKAKNIQSWFMRQISSANKQKLDALVVTSADDFLPITKEISTYFIRPTEVKWEKESDNNPNLTAKSNELFNWMANNFGKDAKAEDNGSGSGDGEKKVDDFKKSIEDSAPKTDDATNGSTKSNVSRSIDGLIDLPSTGGGDSGGLGGTGEIETDSDAMLKKSSEGMDNLFSGLFDLLKRGPEAIRDDVYVMMYVMNMFSYDSMEAEITYKLSKGEDLTSGWWTVDGDTYKQNETWKKYSSQAKTLTKNVISPNFNYLYGSEAEYIVYGNPNSVATAYGTIFLIRFAVNTVYAFTDSEINSATLGLATALFGAPPLTPLIPIAKCAMIIALALAESAWDLNELHEGHPVPLIKTTSTWVMKPSSAGKAVAKKVADKVVDMTFEAGTEYLDELLNKTSDELQEIIDEGEEGLEKLAESATTALQEKLMNYASEALTEAVNLINTENLNRMKQGIQDERDKLLETTQEKIDSVSQALRSWLAQQKNSDSGEIYQVKEIAVNYLLENGSAKLREVMDTIQSTSDARLEELTAENMENKIETALEKKLDEIREAIESKINSAIETGAGKLGEMKDEMIGQLRTAARDGADSLKSSIKSQLNQALGTGEASTSAMSSLLEWRYSDYLTLFLLIAMVKNEQGVLMRIADVIQLNMQNNEKVFGTITTEVTETEEVSRLFGLIKYTKEVTKTETTLNPEAFFLKKSYTYLELETQIQVKPLLMELPFMAETTKETLDGKKWYVIEYSGILGY